MSLKAPPIPLFDGLEELACQRRVSGYFPTWIESRSPYQQQDFFFALEFIYSYRGSEATFNAYRRELERLLQWSWLVANRSIAALKRADIEDYVVFCQNPPTPWIGTKNVKRFTLKEDARVPNPEWRPFVVNIAKSARQAGQLPDVKDYELSQKGLQAIFAVTGSFYNYLIQEEYVEQNPVSMIRQKSKFVRKQQGKTKIRRLTEIQWAYVIETAAIYADKTGDERQLFIMNALYGMYLRISELAASDRWIPQMGHFHCDGDRNWWFTTVGKGNKERDIAVSDAMLNALKRYRQSLNLSLLPSSGETLPLLTKTKGKGPITSTRQVRTIVQSCFDRAIERLIQDGFQEDADQLKSATVHWLRHTGISDDVKIRPREHVRDDAGHGSSAITDRYIDVELRERHASGKKKKILPE